MQHCVFAVLCVHRPCWRAGRGDRQERKPNENNAAQFFGGSRPPPRGAWWLWTTSPAVTVAHPRGPSAGLRIGLPAVLDQPLPQPRRRWVRRIKNSVSGEAVIRLMCALVIGGCVDGHAAWACNVVAVHARAGTGPLAETNFARGGRRSPNRADIARYGAVSCCAHCVRAVHRILRRWCEHSIFFLATCTKLAS